MKSFTILLTVPAISLALTASPLFAATIHVPQDQQTIQAGIDASQDGDTVLVVAGTYSESINFNGKNISVIGNPEDPSTVIIDGNGERCVFFANGETDSAILTGFTIQNGVAHYGEGGGNSGGGIRCAGSNPTLTHPLTRNNHAQNGGAIAIDWSAPVIEGLEICGNEGTVWGGAIEATQSQFTMRNVTIFGNVGQNGGGAILVYQSVVPLINCISWGNSPDELRTWEGGQFNVSYSDIQGGYQGDGNISLDPRFLDPANGNFNLHRGSPCVNSGDPNSPNDPDGTPTDMGAYPFDHSASHNIYVQSDFAGIQPAINDALNGDTIHVEAGTYTENINFNRKNISVIGDPASPDSVIIDGNGRGSVVKFVNGETSDAVLSGFTIRNGVGEDHTFRPTGGHNSMGGGATIIGASPTLEYLVVTHNSAFGAAGILCAEGASPTFHHVRFANNQSEHDGAAMCVWDNANATIRDCEFIQNSTGGYGGAISNTANANVDLANTLFDGNSSAASGGVFWNYAGFGAVVITIDHCTFTRNSAGGGGSVLGGSPVHFTNSILWANQDAIPEGAAQISYSNVQSGYQGEGNISSDPRFFDPDNGNFGLHRGSPCVNAGDPNSPNDPDGTRADMGAFPYNYQGPITLHIPAEYATIQAGIDDAINRDSVLVAAGTYTEKINFNGKNISVIGDPANPDSVIIDGNANGSVVKFVNGETADAHLSGFTIRNGTGEDYTFRPNGWRGPMGGGVRIIGASPTLENLIVTGNNAMAAGGILFAVSGSPTLDHVRIANNYASGSGGGMAVYDGPNVTVRNCSFSHNTTDGYGGAVVNAASCNINFSNTLFTDSRAEAQGGVFWNYHIEGATTMTIDHCTFARNSARNGGSVIDGTNEAGSVVVTNSVVWDGNAIVSVIPAISYTDIQGGFQGDGNVSSDPLFLDPDNGDFHLQVASPCVDTGDPNSLLDPDSTIADMGAYSLTQEWHRIALRRGWGIVSTYTQPRDPAVRTIWSEIVGRGNLILSKDQEGRFYSPSVGQNGFSNMQGWDVRQGYMAKLADVETLVIHNAPTAIDTPIPLRLGWNIVAYFPATDMPAPDAFVNLGDSVILVKDEQGRFFSTANRFSNMGRLTRGKGYQVKAAHATNLVWSAQQREMMENGRWKMEQENANDNVHPVHFVQPEPTGRNMSVLLSVKCKVQSAKWEIGVFTEKGLCVGAGSLCTLHSALCTGLAVWGDDPTTSEIDGAVEGDILVFRLWGGQAETPVLLTWKEGNGRYETDGLGIANISAVADLPKEFAVEAAYPNPFNSRVSLTFALPSSGHAKVAVLDVTGRQVALLADREFKAGRYSLSWDAVGVSSGVYLVRVEAAGRVQIVKAALVR